MGRYADSLLTEGENIVYRTRQHWLALIIRGRSGIALLILGILLIGFVLFAKNIFPDNTLQQTLTSGIGLLLVIVGVVVFAYRFWSWSNQDYVITNRRLLKVTGILNKHSADSSLEKINDAILDQPVLGRMMNYGDLTILTAADEANDRYHMLNSPKEFKKTMLTQKHSLETEFMYAGAMPPTPPLRAEQMPPMEPVQPPPPPMPIPPAPTATDMAPPPMATPVADAPAPGSADPSLDITQTLARLADLRDSGAITVAEYEQKKQELLSRL